MAQTAFDLVVIGAGPGGYVAAIRAAQLGMSVAVVEGKHLGGVCLNWGCIPTKALLRTAEIYELMKHAGDFGLTAKEIGFDIKKVVERSRQIADQLSSGVAYLLRKNKVTVFDGNGRLDGPGRVRVEKDGKAVVRLSTKHVILATGARARTLPGIEPDRKLVWTYNEAMVPDIMPGTLLVIGSGAIGIEFASFYRSLGAEVTVVEILDRILPAEDDEISTLARGQFEKQGIVIHTCTSVKALKKSENTVMATLEGGDKRWDVSADRVILAVGIVGNVETCGLEGSDIRVERSHIVVDEWYRTDEPGVYAIGDVVGPPWLAHKASHEGIACVEKIAGSSEVRPLDRTRIPGCTYSRPQIASIGLTQKVARETGHDVRIGRFPFVGNGKAIAMGEPEGMIKTVFDAVSGELLGAHMVGAEVTELIQGYSIARTLETTETELMETVFPHPTLSEMMHESVLDAYGKAVHF